MPLAIVISASLETTTDVMSPSMALIWSLDPLEEAISRTGQFIASATISAPEKASARMRLSIVTFSCHLESLACRNLHMDSFGGGFAVKARQFEAFWVCPSHG